jgi:membrane fusion protein (multidrug efflux system)
MKPIRSKTTHPDLTPPSSVPALRRRLALSIIAPAAIALMLALPACKNSTAADAKAAQAASANANDGKTGKEAKNDNAVPVEVARATRRPISASYDGTASLDAPDEAQVIAKTSGIVLTLLTEEGQRVQKGQVLARLDSERQVLQVEQAESAVRKLQANYARSQKMLAAKLVSTEADDQIRFDLESAQDALNLAKLELSYTSVLAPISGVVAQRSIKIGNFVQINTPIFRIVDNSRLEATLNVPERDLATLKGGLPVVLVVDALPGKTFDGKVDRIAPVVDAGSGTFRVVCAFNGGGELQPGMFGRIRINYDQRADALVVPRVALLEDEGDPAVFIVRNSKVARVAVKLGFMDGQWAEIRAGLREGDEVVTAGKTTLRDGSDVQLIGAPASPLVTSASNDAVAK